MDRIIINISEEGRQIKRIFNEKDLVTVEELLDKIIELDDKTDELESKLNEDRELEEFDRNKDYYLHDMYK